MKRSAMVEEIASVIHDTILLDEREIAKAVLNKVEALGMKPLVEDVCPIIFKTTHIWERENDG